MWIDVEVGWRGFLSCEENGLMVGSIGKIYVVSLLALGGFSSSFFRWREY